MVDGCANEVIRVIVTDRIAEEKIRKQKFPGNLVRDPKNYGDYWFASLVNASADSDSYDSDDEGRDRSPPIASFSLTIIQIGESSGIEHVFSSIFFLFF